MNNFSIKRNLINIFKIIPNPFPLKKKYIALFYMRLITKGIP